MLQVWYRDEWELVGFNMIIIVDQREDWFFYQDDPHYSVSKLREGTPEDFGYEYIGDL